VPEQPAAAARGIQADPVFMRDNEGNLSLVGLNIYYTYDFPPEGGRVFVTHFNRLDRATYYDWVMPLIAE